MAKAAADSAADDLRTARAPTAPMAADSTAVTGNLYGHTSDDTARAAIDGLTDALGL